MQPGEQMLEFFITQQQRIAAAQEHVPDGWRAPDVVDLGLEVRMKVVSRRIAHQAGPGAIPAIAGATVGHQKEHAVGVAMHQARDG